MITRKTVEIKKDAKLRVERFKFQIRIVNVYDFDLLFTKDILYRESHPLGMLPQGRLEMVCQEFDEALIEAVDFAFRSLGPSIQRSLYFHLKMTFHLSRRSIPRRITEFDRALRFIFKDGASTVEKLILKRLCERLKMEVREDDALDFVRLISKIEQLFSSNVTLSANLTASQVEREGGVKSEKQS